MLRGAGCAEDVEVERGGDWESRLGHQAGGGVLHQKAVGRPIGTTTAGVRAKRTPAIEAWGLRSEVRGERGVGEHRSAIGNALNTIAVVHSK